MEPARLGNLRRGFKVRQLAAGRLFVVQEVLGPDHVHRTGNRNIPKPMEAAFPPPRGNDTAALAARWQVGFDNDPPAAGCDDDRNDSVVGQVE